jgi:hypothetical protein
MLSILKKLEAFPYIRHKKPIISNFGTLLPLNSIKYLEMPGRIERENFYSL